MGAGETRGQDGPRDPPSRCLRRADAADISFRDEGGRHVAALEVAAFLGDGQKRLVGEKWAAVDLRLRPEWFARLARERLTFQIDVPATSVPRMLKVVVYDVGADKVGSTTATVR